MMNITTFVTCILDVAKRVAGVRKDAILTPEHALLALLCEDNFLEATEHLVNFNPIKTELIIYLERLGKTKGEEPKDSDAFQNLLDLIEKIAERENASSIKGEHLFTAFYELEESFCQTVLEDTKKQKVDILIEIRKLEAFLQSNASDKGMNFRLPRIENVDEVEHLGDVVGEVVEAMSKREAAHKAKNVCDLVQPLNNRNLPPVIGRTDIINRTIQILVRCNKNNPIHVGEPGVGKTSIVDALAKMIDEGTVPDKLKNATIYSLNVGDLVAGTQFRGDLEARIKKLLRQLEQDENPILYIDEIHNIIGAGASHEGTMDVSNMLKPYLTNGKIKFIGATTEEEYKKVFSKDKALSRRFQTIEVKEPTVEETIQILSGLKVYYEDFHDVTYTEDAIEAAAKLSNKYIGEKFLPDKAIDLIDEAGAYISTYGDGRIVDKASIEEVLSNICRIPKETVASDEIEKLQTLDLEIKRNLYGQDQAVEEIVRAIKISRAGLMDDRKPIASILMVGPTGVGKTELAKTLAKTLNIGFVRFDMSEYVDSTSVNKLIGASAGYAGYEEGGLLVDAIRKQPHCVLLLDEIEKAHEDIFNVLLQVMDDATLTDNHGRKADFRNVIILMTSNAGAKEVGKMSVGFGATFKDESAIEEAVKGTFSPEFRNRLTGTVIFKSMDESMARKIVEKEIRILSDKMPAVALEFEEAAIQYIAEKGLSDKQFGGRAIKRVIENELKPLFVDELLFGNLKKGGICIVALKEGGFVLKTRSCS